MNKVELASVIAEKTGMTKKATLETIDAFVEAVVETVAGNEDVKISGLGSFVVTEVAERTGTIQLGDRKGETYVTPAHNKVSFKAAGSFKNAVKGE